MSRTMADPFGILQGNGTQDGKEPHGKSLVDTSVLH